MRAVVQRVSFGQVTVGDEVVGKIDTGILVLIGAEKGDLAKDSTYIADKISHLRIFEDQDGKMNLSLLDIGGDALVVSQFTLLGDARKGRRPAFINAEKPELAEGRCDEVVARLKENGIKHVATGRFRTDMKVLLENNGPVTILLDSHKSF